MASFCTECTVAFHVICFTAFHADQDKNDLPMGILETEEREWKEDKKLSHRKRKSVPVPSRKDIQRPIHKKWNYFNQDHK